MTFGLLEGWRLPTDPEQRGAESPLLDIEHWRAVLTQANFRRTMVAADGRPASQAVIVAESDGAIAQTAAAQPPGRPDTPARPLGNGAAPDADVTGPIAAAITAEVCQLLDIAKDEVDPARPLFEIGLDSFLGREAIAKINARLRIDLRPTVLFEHVTIEELTGHIARLIGQRDATTPMP